MFRSTMGHPEQEQAGSWPLGRPLALSPACLSTELKEGFCLGVGGVARNRPH